MEISPRQRELLDFIEKCANFERRMPSFREMAKAMRVQAVGSIQDLVRTLINKGYLEKNGRHLSLATKRSSPSLSIPILGEVAAGNLQHAFEESLGTLPMPADVIRSGRKVEDYFALKVRGDSMIDAGIFEKDLVIVDRKARVQDGDFVVASVNGEATVKELRQPKKSTERISLIPHNKRFKPITLEENQELIMHGKVVALHRSY